MSPEDWAANCFQILLFNLVNPEQKKIIYDQFGLDWKQVLDELHDIITDDDRRERMRESTDIFRVLVKTLLKAGKYRDHGFKNLHIVDLDGALTGETVNLDIIKDIVSKLDLKVEIGGGIRNFESIQKK